MTRLNTLCLDFPARRTVAVRVLQLLPFLTASTLLTLPIPTGTSPAREAAAYFQAQNLLSDGLASFTQITIQESDASIHLYSIVAAPLIKLGYIEGGRLISLLAALGVTYLIARVAGRLWGPRARLLAPSLLWINPYFVRFSYSFVPEMLSILLTLAAVAAVLEYATDGRNEWYYVGLLLVVLGVFNHGWEAIVVLPFSAVLVTSNHQKKAGIAWIVTVGSLAFVKFVSTFQNNIGSTTTFGVQHTGIGIFFTSDWWMRWLSPWYYRLDYITAYGQYSGPFYFAEKVLFALGIAGVVFWTLKLLRTRDNANILTMSWTVSGISIPFLLPGGTQHLYYLWASIVPATLTIAYILQVGLRRLQRVTGRRTAETTLNIVVCALIVSGVAYIGVVETGLFSSSKPRVATEPAHLDSDEPIEAGLVIRIYGVDDMSDISFVGNWSRQFEMDDIWTGNHWPTIIRLLIYSGVDVGGSWKHWRVETVSPQSAIGPQFTANANESGSCDVKVIKADDGVLDVVHC